MHSRLIQILLFVVLAAPAAQACTVPVFRYALERWETAPCQAIVFHRGALGAAEKECVDALKAAGEGPLANANLRVELFDLDAKPETKRAQAQAAAMTKLWAAQKDATLPWAVLLYPEGNEELPPFWAGPLKRDWIAPLINSPVRSDIARRLTSGDSAVWVLLQTGEKEKDAAASKVLKAEVAKLQETIALPKEEDTQGGPQVRLRSDLPLKISFSIIEVSRRDTAEAFLVAMLSGMDKTFKDPAQPVAFPIFGRGRALVGLTGKQFTPETIEEATLFLTGACSCQVKELNPGVDVLFAADWEALLEGRKDEEPPAPRAPNVSLPVLPVLTEKKPVETIPIAAPAPPPPAKVESRADAAVDSTRSWILAGMVVAGLAALVSAFVLFKSRARK